MRDRKRAGRAKARKPLLTEQWHTDALTEQWHAGALTEQWHAGALTEEEHAGRAWRSRDRKGAGWRQPARLDERASGVLLHFTSLPGAPGCGDLGPAAHEFVDFLHAAGQRWWQVLPIQAVGRSGSPYSALSAFAGNPLLISPEQLVQQGLLKRSELRLTWPGGVARTSGTCADRAGFKLAAQMRKRALRAAFREFVAGGGPERSNFLDYQDRQRAWLAPFARFMALRRRFRDRAWAKWPDGYRRASRAKNSTNDADANRSSSRSLGEQLAGARAGAALTEAILFEEFVQFVFDEQFAALRSYAASRGVALLGDVPIFVAYDSCDVWSRPELFELDKAGRPKVVSGVPPDFFSRKGQVWRHPLYRWRRHEAEEFAWWVARFRRAAEMFDAVRVDHFIGFHRLWAIPNGARTARDGRWMRTPGEALLGAVRRKLGELNIVAEDLGCLTPQAAALRDRFGFPGMRVLQFGFDSDELGAVRYRPHTYPRECVCYTGTHDNATIVAWYAGLRGARAKADRVSGSPGTARVGRKGEARSSRLAPRIRYRVQGDHARSSDSVSDAAMTPRERVNAYTGTDGRDIHWDMIRLAMTSPANLAIIPAQDLLGLGDEARVNRPGTTRGNWTWRLREGALTDALARRLAALTRVSGRDATRQQA